MGCNTSTATIDSPPNMPSTYKLVYLNLRGRAEISRLLFSYAGVKFEDRRISFEEFGANKSDISKFPTGKMPVLFVDNHPPITQCKAIERFLARQFGLYGNNNFDACRIDMICESLLDIFDGFFKINSEKDDTKKEELKNTFVNESSVPLFNLLVRMLESNNGGKGFFVGNAGTMADMAALANFDMLAGNLPGVMDKYPVLKEYHMRIKKDPKVAQYLAARPNSNI